MNKGGLFPLGVPFIGQSRAHRSLQPTITQAELLYFRGTYGRWPDKSINSVRSLTCCAEEGGWREIIALPVCAKRPGQFITQRQRLLLNDNSVSFHFTYNVRPSTLHHGNQRRQWHCCPFLHLSVPPAGSLHPATHHILKMLQIDTTVSSFLNCPPQ